MNLLTVSTLDIVALRVWVLHFAYNATDSMVSESSRLTTQVLFKQRKSQSRPPKQSITLQVDETDGALFSCLAFLMCLS